MDSIRATMIIWMLGGKTELFFAVLCMTVVHNDTHTREQFLNRYVGVGLDLAFVYLFMFIILCVCLLFVLGLVS